MLEAGEAKEVVLVGASVLEDLVELEVEINVPQNQNALGHNEEVGGQAHKTLLVEALAVQLPVLVLDVGWPHFFEAQPLSALELLEG